jgi:hypothetical protein
MIGRPQNDEAAPYYFTYINQAPGDDPVALLEAQVEQYAPLFARIAEDKSLYRYAPGKWSIRQVLSHVSDTERAFAFRALWFGRGFETPLFSFEQDVAVAGAEADRIAWSEHVEEFRGVRLATIALFRHMPAQAWSRRGTAGGNPFTVRALAFITAGHLAHHARILQEKYL